MPKSTPSPNLASLLTTEMKFLTQASSIDLTQVDNVKITLLVQYEKKELTKEFNFAIQGVPENFYHQLDIIASLLDNEVGNNTADFKRSNWLIAFRFPGKPEDELLSSTQRFGKDG